MLERLHLSQTARPVDTLTYWKKDGNLLLSPPYQRGEVWGPIRQKNLIKSIITGIPIPSIIINDRDKGGWKDDYFYAVIDGKQRITAILKFLESELEVPGEWFGLEGNVLFSQIPLPDQRHFRMTPIQFSEGSLKTLDQEKEIFDLVNFGGVPQGETDL